MVKFQAYETLREARFSTEWYPVAKFTSQGQKVQFQGKNYIVIDKRARLFSSLERFGRALLAILAVVASCGFALISKSVRYLFSEKEEIQRRAVREFDTSRGVITFYNHHQPATEFMGNFYPCEVFFRDIAFQCAEAAFQGAKYSYNEKWMKEFASLDGEAAFQKSRAKEHELRGDWDVIRCDGEPWKVWVMRDILYDKFVGNPDLMEMLKATGEAYLIEHNTRCGKDSYWSDNHDGSGKNMLGMLLMQLREILQTGNDPKEFLDAALRPPLQKFTRKTKAVDNFYKSLSL